MSFWNFFVPMLNCKKLARCCFAKLLIGANGRKNSFINQMRLGASFRGHGVVKSLLLIKFYGVLRWSNIIQYKGYAKEHNTELSKDSRSIIAQFVQENNNNIADGEAWKTEYRTEHLTTPCVLPCTKVCVSARKNGRVWTQVSFNLFLDS